MSNLFDALCLVMWSGFLGYVIGRPTGVKGVPCSPIPSADGQTSMAVDVKDMTALGEKVYDSAISCLEMSACCGDGFAYTSIARITIRGRKTVKMTFEVVE